MPRLASTFFLSAATFALLGMIWGIQMSATHDHSLSAAHGHLNLIGFVAMSVYGAFYALSPQMADSGLARLHFITALLAVVVIAPGIAVAISTENPMIAQIGSVLTLISMVLFIVIIFRSRRLAGT
ncbi:hypothetical protein [Yoonia litorea]|uniref:Uncharacterized protein n=1 Tax=Yoonia litorea TaxID=1123755 RepID=A0A1I6MTP7_9RHOB|nr:hypothetical protein [Yoonia litorea]SFS19017.1 hypothetical protein SAMN05444714_2076 [Yoonia litorea]